MRVSKGETIQHYKCSQEGLNIYVILTYKRDKFDILQCIQLLCGPQIKQNCRNNLGRYWVQRDQCVFFLCTRPSRSEGCGVGMGRCNSRSGEESHQLTSVPNTKAGEDMIFRFSEAGKGHALCTQSLSKVIEVGEMTLCNYDQLAPLCKHITAVAQECSCLIGMHKRI